MAKVILVRHGKPDFGIAGRISASEVPELIRRYDAARLETASMPPQALVELARTCSYTVCSDLPRSIESAGRLGVESVHLSDSLFREARLPYAMPPLLKLSPYLWFLLFRALWFTGFAANGESLREARTRAAKAADRLQALAAEHGTVLFVGHGLLNSLIARELLAGRWSGPGSPGTGYWDFAVYSLGQD